MNFFQLLLPIIIILFGLNACSTSFKGTLVDARNYLNLNVDSQTPSGQFSAFYAMKANLPAGIKTTKGKFVLLSNSSSQLSKYASSAVKVKGPYLPRQSLLKATRFWVKTENGWKSIPLH